jgi:hypothetical protein
MQMLGVAVSFVGVLAIMSQGKLVAIEGLRLNVGDLLIVASMAMCSLYTIGLAWRPEGLGLANGSRCSTSQVSR